MPTSSSLRNSQSRESRLSLTSSPVPFFIPRSKWPVQVMPSLISVSTHFPLASCAGMSPWNSTSLFSSPRFTILNRSSLAMKRRKNSSVLASCLFFSSSITDFRFEFSTFLRPVRRRISSQSSGVSSSMSPKSWQPRSSLPSFSLISRQVRLQKGRMASLWQFLELWTEYLAREKLFSPILSSLALISLKSALSRMSFCSRARLERQKRLASSSMKKQRISQVFLTRFSRKRMPIRQFRQCIYININILLEALVARGQRYPQYPPVLPCAIDYLQVISLFLNTRTMLNQNVVFREQLKRILTNVNKKHAVLRKEIIKTGDVFENDHLPIFPYEVCFGLFRQLPEANSLSASLAFFPFLQNIINLGFANEEMTREIITLLTHIKALPKFHGFENQTRLQQILLLLVSKNTISLHNLPYTHSIINILMALENQKHRTVWIKTFAILVQISLLYLNELKDESTQLRRDRFLAYLSDIILLSRGENVKWLLEPSEPFLFMSLLAELLDEKYFREHKEEYSQPLIAMVAPLRKFSVKLYEGAFYQLPSSPSKHWELPVESKLVICLRVCCKISRLYETCFELLEELIKVVTEKGSTSLKVIGYECINYLFGSSRWMHAMLQSSSGDLFNFLMTTLFNSVKLIQPELKEGPELLQRYELEKSQKIFTTNSLEFHLLDLPPATEIKCILKSIDEISFTFFSIYSEVYGLKLDQRIEAKPPLEKTYKFCHKTIFEIVKAIIGREIGEETLQSILKISERFINLAGVFGDAATSGVFIKLMCRYCLPTGHRPIGQRHVQINKMILSTANCLGNLFSTGCWVTVWKALENYSLYYNRYLLGKEELQAERENDVQILYASMESIFTQSHKYEDKYLMNILQSLVEVTYECLENNYSDEHRKIFAFERIEQIFKLNLFRIEKIWHDLLSSLLILTTSKVQYFRLASLSLINALIPIALHYLHTHKEALGPTMQEQDYESVILDPWNNLSASPFNEIRSELAVSVGKLVIDYGHIMTHGWRTILGVARRLQDLTSLQAIVETFLDKINPYILEAIEIIDEVERSLSDSNQKYLCLTLIWGIGDYAHRHNQPEVMRKIYALLLQPEEMFVLGTEARHSSFYILAELLVHNCNEKEQEFWAWIFERIEFFYGYSVDKCNEVRERVNFEEILKNLLANILKIYRKCFILLDSSSNEPFIKEKLENFFRLVNRYLNFRQSEIFQSTLKQVREILVIKGDLIIELDQYNAFIQKLTEIYYIENDNKILKSLITYLPVDIYEILVHSFPKVWKKLSLVYKLIEKVFLLRLQAEEKDIKIHQLRIFFQEKLFFEFWKKFHNFIMETNDEALIRDFLEMFTMTLYKLILYEDYLFLSKMLPFLNLINERYCNKLDNDHTIDLYTALLKLKESESWRIKHGKSKDVPIWLIASNETIKLGYMLEKQAQSNQVCLRVFKKFLLTLCQILGKHLSSTAKEQESSVDYLTYFYDSECSLLYFVLEHYLLNVKLNIDISKEEQSHLYSVVAAEISHFKENDKTGRSKNMYDILFKVLPKKQDSTKEVIARQAGLIKILIKQLVLSFQVYLKTETQKPQSDIESEIKYVLKKLIQLDINIEAYPVIYDFIKSEVKEVPHETSAIYKHPKAIHFILTPYLLRLIRSGSSQMREIVQEVLQLTYSVLITQISI